MECDFHINEHKILKKELNQSEWSTQYLIHYIMSIIQENKSMSTTLDMV